MIADTSVGIGTGIGTGVSALTSQLDRLNDGFTKSLAFGGGPHRALESLPTLDDVFEGILPDSPRTAAATTC